MNAVVKLCSRRDYVNTGKGKPLKVIKLKTYYTREINWAENTLYLERINDELLYVIIQFLLLPRNLFGFCWTQDTGIDNPSSECVWLFFYFSGIHSPQFHYCFVIF